ncbi:hypothetical protein ACFU9B_25835 [Streptomyces sp. NPDC057592]
MNTQRLRNWIRAADRHPLVERGAAGMAHGLNDPLRAHELPGDI